VVARECIRLTGTDSTEKNKQAQHAESIPFGRAWFPVAIGAITNHIKITAVEAYLYAKNGARIFQFSNGGQWLLGTIRTPREGNARLTELMSMAIMNHLIAVGQP
jgi:hypothetical protein